MGEFMLRLKNYPGAVAGSEFHTAGLNDGIYDCRRFSWKVEPAEHCQTNEDSALSRQQWRH